MTINKLSNALIVSDKDSEKNFARSARNIKNIKVINEKGANIYVEGQLSTRKWKDESSGQDKYSTEIVLQGYNSSLTMLDSKNSADSNSNLVSENKSSLPKDNLNQENSDLDDEIPF